MFSSYHDWIARQSLMASQGAEIKQGVAQGKTTTKAKKRDASDKEKQIKLPYRLVSTLTAPPGLNFEDIGQRSDDNNMLRYHLGEQCKRRTETSVTQKQQHKPPKEQALKLPYRLVSTRRHLQTEL